MNPLIHELQPLQNEIIHIVEGLTEQEYQQQYHQDLSPIGWHLGHCIYTESYWIKEKLLEQTEADAILKSQYIPELNPKSARSSSLPQKDELLDWSKKSQSDNLLLLKSITNNNHPLLKNNFLYLFLIQHYSQHLETIQMIMTEKQLKSPKQEVHITDELKPMESQASVNNIQSGEYQIGSENYGLPYDNEHSAHMVRLENYKISKSPVTNSEYLMFITEGGYTNNHYWSDTGWQWVNKNKITHPHHWHLHDNQYWVGINFQGSYQLDPADPVHGLNYYEATAYANWADARLPHEYEWEVASKMNMLDKTYGVWEWCSNTFHPYTGFIPYPYEGYSTPYFDDDHFVLKGGSIHTKKYIKRPSFRNYYQPDKRHIFAGLRLIYD